MKPDKQTFLDSNTAIDVLLADDDGDDRHFFERVLKSIPIATDFTAVADGEKLINYLKDNPLNFPHVLFLDFNMPRKNGLECLNEIQLDENLRHLPVIIYSTSLHEEMADLLYKNGAYYYVKKTDLIELKIVLFSVLTMISNNTFKRPERKEFILSLSLV